MENKGIVRTVMLWALVVFSALYSVPTLVGGADKLPLWYSNLFASELSYGLDLQGGLELRYTVDWKKAIEDNARKLGDSVRSSVVEALAKAENQNPNDLSNEAWDAFAVRVGIEVPDYTTIHVSFKDEAAAKAMSLDDLVQQDQRFDVLPGAEGSYDLILRDDEVVKIRNQVVTETQSIIRERVEAFGLVDPDVRIAGEADIAVQIPGVG
jgi:preprotein translocase subunit SecD